MESPFFCRLEYFYVPEQREYPGLFPMEFRVILLSHWISPLNIVPGSLQQAQASQTKARLGSAVLSRLSTKFTYTPKQLPQIVFGWALHFEICLLFYALALCF